MLDAALDESQPASRLLKNINNLSYEDDTILLAESEEN